ncbi:ParA family protein [Cellulophaga sp. BC115SP]|uniref:ParA family protein n=1 Tax=Cellulophaga sp. BC115SP TaxID=2683263 RepID=UPI00196B78CB|nr:ParA family protein [Cellulophaga sp. BC115SP]
MNLSQLEKDASLPKKTLYKALQGALTLNEKHCSLLEPILREYGYADELFSKAKVISIVNHKGGVGKTTTTINLGKALAISGFKVLLVDFDSQGNTSQCFGEYAPEVQVIDAILDNIDMPIIEIEENFYLSPSNIKMAYCETDLVNSIGNEKRLRNKLNQINEQFDYILIDCPPALNIFTTNALVASDMCIVPLQPEAYAFYGVENLFNRIYEIRQHVNNTLVVKGILFTMVSNTLVHKQMMTFVKDQYKHIPVFNVSIERATIIQQSQVAQKDLFSYAPKSVVANQYMDLAKEFMAI